MSRKLAIFWHGRLSGGNPPVTTYARTILREQMDALVAVGLYDEANLLVVGLNQGTADGVQSLVPPGAEVVCHGDTAESECPTLSLLQDWLPGHEDWYVLYFHAKGARHGGEPLTVAWRQCMERAVLWRWRRCVYDLDTGLDSAGAHWLTPEKYGAIVKSPFWGGNFWWAKASFLKTLPRLLKVPKNYDDFFAAEMWIGTGPARPRVRDYGDHWPNLQRCSMNGR